MMNLMNMGVQHNLMNMMQSGAGKGPGGGKLVKPSWKGKGSGGGKSSRAAGGSAQTATVRYVDAETAQRAVEQLNASSMNGTPIEVAHDPRSPDGRKVIVSNIPSEAEWQEIKDHFKAVGKVEFADFLALSANFGKDVGGAESVPEPSSLLLLGLAGLMGGLLRRRRS